MVMSRLMLVGVITILLALGALTGYAFLGANAPVKGSGLSFTEQRPMDAQKGGFDRHDANVMRAVRSMGADGTDKLDRHDANVMRYTGTNAASGATGPDRHDANVMRYFQMTTK